MVARLGLGLGLGWGLAKNREKMKTEQDITSLNLT